MIAIVDYGIGNLGSAAKAFRHVGAEAVLSGDPAVLAQADTLVLPGDGAFGAAMDELRQRSLLPVLQEAVAQGRTLGALTLVTTGERPLLTPNELARAEDLAGRAGLALANAIHHQRALLEPGSPGPPGPPPGGGGGGVVPGGVPPTEGICTVSAPVGSAGGEPAGGETGGLALGSTG